MSMYAYSGTGGRASLSVSVNQLISQTPNASEAAMSQVRVHNFSISLDGFGTGEGLTFDAPFGHAGHRLHEWVFPTQFGRSIIMGQSGGTTGVDNAFAERLNVGFGAEIMGRGKFGPQTGPWTDLGTDDEWRGWWGPNPPFHTPVFVLTHHPRRRSRWRAAPCSTSSTPLRRRLSTSPGRLQANSMCVSAVAQPLSATSSPPTSSTPSTSYWCRSFSAAAFDCGTISKASRSATTAKQSRHPVVSPI